jgi:tetratricopeptide (TPR) repeat protein
MPAMRFFTLALSIAFSGLALTGARAADQAVTTAAPNKVPDKVTEDGPGPLAPQDQQLDSLFAKLKRERSPEVAHAIADQIRQAFTVSGSATVDMLMASSSKALEEKRYGAALDFVDQVTLLAPKFAEGWNRRATIHYLMGNYGKSMSDVARTLALEPRHIGALSGLAGILEDSGHDAQALKAWEAYLSYYPADRDAQKEALDLINKLSGQKT